MLHLNDIFKWIDETKQWKILSFFFNVNSVPFQIKFGINFFFLLLNSVGFISIFLKYKLNKQNANEVELNGCRRRSSCFINDEKILETQGKRTDFWFDRRLFFFFWESENIIDIGDFLLNFTKIWNRRFLQNAPLVHYSKKKKLVLGNDKDFWFFFFFFTLLKGSYIQIEIIIRILLLAEEK